MSAHDVGLYVISDLFWEVINPLLWWLCRSSQSQRCWRRPCSCSDKRCFKSWTPFSMTSYNPYVWNLAWYYLEITCLAQLNETVKLNSGTHHITGWDKGMLWIGHTCHLKVRLGLLENLLWGAKPFLELGRSWLPRGALGLILFLRQSFLVSFGARLEVFLCLVLSRLPVFSFSNQPITLWHWISYLPHWEYFVMWSFIQALNFVSLDLYPDARSW